MYPNDAFGFICPYSCKEMKDAGVSINLTPGIIPAPPNNYTINDINQLLSTTASSVTASSFNKIILLSIDYKDIENIIENFHIQDSNIILYQNHLQQHEYNILKNKFKNYHFFHINDTLYFGNVINTYPTGLNHFEKFILFNNNIKHKIAYNGQLTKHSALLTFDYYLYLKKLLKYCHIYQYDNYIHIFMCENIILKYHPIYDIYVSPNEFNYTFQQELKLSDQYFYLYFSNLYQKLPDKYMKNTISTKITVTLNNIRGACYEKIGLYDYQAFLYSPGYNVAIDFKNKYDYTDLAVCGYRRKRKYNTQKKYFSSKCTDSQFKGLRLYTAFVHHPITVEDGFVIDKTFAENGPDLHVSINLVTRLMKDNVKLIQKDIKKLQIQYVPINKIVDSYILFGYLYSKEYIKILPNRKIIVEEIETKGFHWYYFYFKIEGNGYDYQISSYDHFSNQPQNFKLQPIITKSIFYKLKIGIGTKICNSFGQKGVIAAVEDLSKYKAYTKDGKIVHAQVLMGIPSSVGRMAAGQTLQMHQSNKCALSDKLELVSVDDFWVSSIHSSFKLSSVVTRIDALKVCNGFDGNKLTMTNTILAHQSSAISKWDNLNHTLSVQEHKGIQFNFNLLDSPL